jgi:hypothetical protein
VSAYRRPQTSSTSPTREEEINKIPKKVWDILKEGR